MKEYPSPFMSKVAKPIYTGNEVQGLIDKLFYFPIKLQFLHHNTNSYAKHQATSFAYDAMDGFKDDIIEKIIGCTGQRYDSITIPTISGYSDEACLMVADEIKMFAKELKKYAEEYGYLDISQISDSIEGTGAKLKYLLSLS